MYSVDIPRRRSVGTEKAMKQKPLVQMFELNVMENGSAGDYGKPSEAAKLALLAQAGAYIPLHRLYDLMFTLTITAISVFVRTYRIEYPPQVVFDEAHFGKFAANYINGTFFFDVHPPLGKLLIAGAGHLSGFDGAYTFETIGGSYEGKVPHVPMRLFCATFGLLTIPIAYLTIRVAGFSKLAGFMAAVLMCFENGFVTNHRLILLDAPQLFFTSLAALCWFNFQNQNQRPFSGWWWFWQLATGVSLGAVVSVKWVGLFTIATVGLAVISELWSILCDTRVTPMTFGKHFVARSICLIFVPVSIYLACFWVHFKVLPRSGDGEFVMSAAFRYNLQGSTLKSTFADVSYGSKLNIKQNSGNEAYLHSHPLYYPTGSKQQQVTMYEHNDYHNDWIMIKSTTTIEPNSEENSDPVTWVKDGDIVRLMHPITKAYLHSHQMKPPVTESEYHFEVSAYMALNDSNNNWRVEIVSGSDSDPQSKKRIRSLRTMFRLVHVNMNCALYARDKFLPAWGSDQQEVTCMRDAKKNQFSTFYVESSLDDRFTENDTKVEYEMPSFWQNFVTLNKEMYISNEGLTESHPFESRPGDWPLLHRGINYWSKERRQIYLLGNPIAFWASASSAVAFILSKAYVAVREQRGWKFANRNLVSFYAGPADFFTLAWLLHWLPFFSMKRQLFLHHYMPSLYFAILVSVVGFEYYTKRLPNPLRYGIAASIVASYLYFFWILSPIAYGLDWTMDQCNANRKRHSWDFNCNSFPTTLSEYEPTT